MEAKEKAKELVERFKEYSHFYIDPDLEVKELEENAKQCALICVDEILENLSNINLRLHQITFWEEVKQEIQSL